MHLKLKVLRGASSGKEVAVQGPRFFIGRSEECHLRANSDAISRRHCAITLKGDEVQIRDLGSRNGTYVNGKRIEGDHRIQLGDQLRVGPLEFLVTYLKPATASATAAKPVGSASGNEDEMAGLIDDWLSESDEQAQRSRVVENETREFRLDETERIDLKRAAAKAEAAKTQAAAGASDDAEPEKKTPASAGPVPRRSQSKPAPKDTQEAAAQTLRKFFNRGG